MAVVTKVLGIYRQVLNALAALLLAAILIVPTFLIAPSAKAAAVHEHHLQLKGLKGSVQADLQTHTFPKVSIFHFKKGHKGIIPERINLAKITSFILSPINGLAANALPAAFHPLENTGLVVDHYCLLRLGALII